MQMHEPVKFNTPRLADKAILVKLTIRRAALTRKDQRLTADVQAQHNDASLTVLTKLFRDKTSPIYQIMQAVGAVYAHHKKHTLPWVDAGPRLLPTRRYEEYTKQMRALIAEVDALMAQHLPNYYSLVRADIAYRNRGQAIGRASEADYPSGADFERSMSFDLRFQPMPDQSHFLFDLTPEDRQAFDDSLAQVERLARADVIQRMLEPLQHLAEKLSTPIDSEGSIFRDSAVINVVEGCRVARELCLDDDPALLEAIKDLERIATAYKFGVNHLRQSPEARSQAAQRLADAAKRLEGYQL